MEIKGTITQLLPVESGTSKNGTAWSNMMFIIDTGGQYPKQVALQLSGKSLDYNKDKLKVGQTITAKFEATSREYNGKWYTQLGAYNVEIHAPAMVDSQESSGHFVDADPSDLPF